MSDLGVSQVATETITRELVRSIQPADKVFEIRDAKLPGFLLRVSPSGRLMYVCQYGRGKRINVGRADVLTPSEAREKARQTLAEAAKGIDPVQKRRQEKARAEAHTFESYIREKYLPWYETRYSGSDETTRRLEKLFLPAFGDRKLEQITGWDVEKWRSARLKAGISKATLNRDVGVLKGALSRAVDWGLLAAHPLARVKPMKLDSKGPVRFLSDDEEARLRAALEAEELEGHFLPPMVLLSLNTGMRKGEVFGLKWSDVDLDHARITVRGEGAKSGQTRHIPLNAEAVETLASWRLDSPGEDSAYVFPGEGGKRLVNIIGYWRQVLAEARIDNFRWHDLRHTFASNLAMQGIDLNIIRDLLGHADISMVLRYAHLNDEVKARAVAVLNRGVKAATPIRRTGK
ncbi:MAG: site-specific integrase [Actinobacteria bacterium]|nr:MAG: site-specific integrase [Actinomycetota bacterium]